MLREVDKGKFWSTIIVKTIMTKHGDVQVYRDAVNGAMIGYINTFVRRYFLVVKAEDNDLDFVWQVKLTPQEVKEEKVKAKAKAKDPNEIFTKYPHAIPGTLTTAKQLGVLSTGKNTVRIRCVDCGNEERVVNTSDLFQVKRCVACQLKVKEARRAVEAEARELVRSKQLTNV